jgi:hypothetical protein
MDEPPTTRFPGGGESDRQIYLTWLWVMVSDRGVAVERE